MDMNNSVWIDQEGAFSLWGGKQRQKNWDNCNNINNNQQKKKANKI